MTGPKPKPPPDGVKMDDVLRRMLATPPDPKKSKKIAPKRKKA